MRFVSLCLYVFYCQSVKEVTRHENCFIRIFFFFPFFFFIRGCLELYDLFVTGTQLQQKHTTATNRVIVTTQCAYAYSQFCSMSERDGNTTKETHKTQSHAPLLLLPSLFVAVDTTNGRRFNWFFSNTNDSFTLNDQSNGRYFFSLFENKF